MSEHDPARLFQDPSASEAMRSALDAARRDLPSEGELASLASRLGPLLLPPGGGGGAIDPSPSIGAGSSGLAAKGIAVLAAAAAVSGVVWWGASGLAPEPRVEPRPEPVVERAEL